MSVVGSAIRYIDDRINPIVIKELRQAVRGRFLPTLLMFVLVGQVAIVGMYLVLGDESINTDPNLGGRIFQALFFVVLAGTYLFIPLHTGARLGDERSNANVNLMFISTIRPRTIVIGKVLSGLILALLVFSASAPFMALTFLLRGIDLVTVFLLIIFAFIVLMGAIQFAVLIGSLPVKKGLRTVLWVIMFLGLLLTLGSVFGGAVSLSTAGLAAMIGTKAFWGMSGSLALGIISAMALNYACSVAVLSPPTSNRMFVLRITALAVWLVQGGVAVLWALNSAAGEPLYGWALGSLFLIVFLFLVASSEREIYGPRLRRSIPKNLLLRFFAFFFYSGAAGGIAFCVVLAAATVGVCSLWSSSSSLPISGMLRGRVVPGIPASHVSDLQVLASAMLYAFAYTLTGIHFRRALPRQQASPQHTWIVILLLVALASVVPIVLSIVILGGVPPFTQGSHPFVTLLFVACPFVISVNGIREYSLSFGLIWAVGIALLSVPWFVEQVRQFRPLSEQVPPRKADTSEAKQVST